MKLLAGLFMFFAVQALADSCDSVWVYRPYLTCNTPANGPDTDQPAEATETVEIRTEYIDRLAGDQQEQTCRDLTASRNAGGVKMGIFYTFLKVDPSGELSTNGPLRSNYKYSYVCVMEKSRYPFKTKSSEGCGFEGEKYSVRTQGTSGEIQRLGKGSCLTCDPQLALNSPNVGKVTADCLRNNITTIVNNPENSSELRPEDIAKLKNRVQDMIDANKNSASRFIDFQTNMIFTQFLSHH